MRTVLERVSMKEGMARREDMKMESRGGRRARGHEGKLASIWGLNYQYLSVLRSPKETCLIMHLIGITKVGQFRPARSQVFQLMRGHDSRIRGVVRAGKPEKKEKRAAGFILYLSGAL